MTRNEVTVTYSAKQEIAAADSLCEIVKEKVQSHLSSITEIDVQKCKLAIDIDTCQMEPGFGRIVMNINGQINDIPINSRIDASDQRDLGPGWHWKARANRETTAAFINVFTALFRLLFPSKTVRAIGHRRISGRLIRAIEDSYRRIRLEIDSTLGRKKTDSKARLTRYLIYASTVSVLAFVFCLAFYFIRQSHLKDPFNAALAIGFIPLGFFGAIFGYALLSMPARYYQAEEAGIKMVKLFGVKSLGAIRGVSFSILVLSLLFFAAPGIYWLFVQ